MASRSRIDRVSFNPSGGADNTSFNPSGGADNTSFDPSGGADDTPLRPSSILLAEEAYLAFSRNETSARAQSRAGHIVDVTFWIADPPAVSFYTFHCSMPPISDCEDADLEDQPLVVGAQGRFILLRTRFLSGDDEDEYFIYEGDSRWPSLRSIPLPDDDRLRGVKEFGIVPIGNRGYLLAGLRDTVDFRNYRLHIFSSEDRTWRTRELLNPCPELYTIIPAKVMMLQDGVLCWVDFLRGLVVCDLFQEPLRAQYIPLPEPLPENRQKVKQFHPCPRCFRDVSCVDGMIKFIEMEHRVITSEIKGAPEKPFDPRSTDILFDSDIIMQSKYTDLENNKPKITRSMNGWSAVTWTRNVPSKFWRKGHDVDVDDILVDDSAYSALLPDQRNGSSGSLSFKNLYSAWPILSTDANNLLYLKSFLNLSDPNRWVVAVDLAERTLKVEPLLAHPFGSYAPSQQTFRPSTLSNHLSRTQGIKVSALITKAGSSSNEPNNTAICTGEPDPYESENKRPRLSPEKDSHVQSGAQEQVI